MYPDTLVSAIKELAARLDNPILSDADVIRWGSPIPSFGDLTNSKIATVGLNPSNNEFLGKDGEELTGSERRFHTLESLRLKQWSDIRHHDVARLLDTYTFYFQRNPYDTWFSQLEFILSNTGTTFYGNNSSACHLDLVPFATRCKWTSLSTSQKALLLDQSGTFLAQCINASKLQLLILNGKSVVDTVKVLFGVDFHTSTKNDWILPRRGGHGVKGYSYVGDIDSMFGKSLSRKIRIIGFNHNLQSSFGVTNSVRASIRNWVAKHARNFLN